MTASPAPPVPKAATACSEAEMVEVFAALREPAFRVTQLREFLYRKGVAGYDGVTNLSKTLRKQLAERMPLYELEAAGRQEGDDAAKWLWKARDGALIESVQIRVPGRLTSCLSSQVGCAMGCVFCATGLGGFERSLAAHEIVEQYLQMWGHSGEHSSHVVFMGMGEPLHNYDEVMQAIRTLNAPPPKGCGIGARRITISTVGIVPGILKLAGEQLQLELAVSLHAPDEETRARLIPASRRYPIREVMPAVREFCRKARRMVTFEYVLLAGINDSVAQARELAGLLQDLPCKANLIPFNPVAETPYERPSREAQDAFKAVLDAAQIPTTIRFSKGKSVAAACGQLRRERAPSA
ncbi:MAG: putative dual-specificity RNA methyltransferase RlmN [Planctomycetota bacterium]